jgi:hypothetical protein
MVPYAVLGTLWGELSHPFRGESRSIDSRQHRNACIAGHKSGWGNATTLLKVKAVLWDGRASDKKEL